MDMNIEPEIDAGIFLSDEIEFVLGNEFYSGHIKFTAGTYKAHLKNSKIIVTNSSDKAFEKNVFLFSPAGELTTSYFELKNVVIGVGFHWEQKEHQRFRGSLKLLYE